MKRCLGCCRYFPEDEFRGFGRHITHFCDDCLERGLTDEMRRMSKRVGRSPRWQSTRHVMTPEERMEARRKSNRESRWRHIDARRAADRDYNQNRRAA